MQSENSFLQILTPDGKPAAGVTVFRFGAMVHQSFYVGQAERTDARGRIPRGSPYFQGIIAVPESGPLSFLAVAPKSDTLRLTGEAITLSLTLLNENRQPYVGMRVCLQPTKEEKALDGTVRSWGNDYHDAVLTRALCAVTDANGTVQFSRLPRGARVQVTFAVANEGGRLLNGALHLKESAVTLVLPRNGVVEGRVYRKRDGVPFGKARVALSEPGDGVRPYSGTTITDAQGRYRFEKLFLAPYSVGVQEPDGWLSEQRGEPVTLKLDRTKMPCDLALEREAKLVGTVIGGDGRPVFGATFWAENPTEGGSGQQVTVEGKATISLRPGAYTVGWESPARQGVRNDTQRILLREGEVKEIRLGPAPKVPFSRAPDVELVTPTGQRIRLATFRGRPLVLIFTEADYLDRVLALEKRIRQSGVRGVAGLVVDVGQGHKLPLPPGSGLQLFRDVKGTLREAFALTGWPTSFLIAPDGSMVGQSGSEFDDVSLASLLTRRR